MALKMKCNGVFTLSRYFLLALIVIYFRTLLFSEMQTLKKKKRLTLYLTFQSHRSSNLMVQLNSHNDFLLVSNIKHTSIPSSRC